MNYRDVAHTAAKGKSPQRSLLSPSPVRNNTPVPPGRPLNVQRLIPTSGAQSPSKIPEKIFYASKGSLKVDVVKVLRDRDSVTPKPKVHLQSALKVDMASVLKSRQKNVKSPIPSGSSSNTPFSVITENAVNTPNQDKKVAIKSLPPASTKIRIKTPPVTTQEPSPVSSALSATSVPTNIPQKDMPEPSSLTSPQLSPIASRKESPVSGSPSLLVASLAKDGGKSGKLKRVSPEQQSKLARAKPLEISDSPVSTKKKLPSESSPKASFMKDNKLSSTRKSTPENDATIRQKSKRFDDESKRYVDQTEPPNIELSGSSSLRIDGADAKQTPSHRIRTTFSESSSSSSTDCVLSSNEALKLAKDKKLKLLDKWKPHSSKRKVSKQQSVENIDSDDNKNDENVSSQRSKKKAVGQLDKEQSDSVDEDAEQQAEFDIINFLVRSKSITDSIETSNFTTTMSHDDTELNQLDSDSSDNPELQKKMDNVFKEQTQKLQHQLEEQRQLRLQLEKQQEIQLQLQKQQQELQRQLLKMQQGTGQSEMPNVMKTLNNIISAQSQSNETNKKLMKPLEDLVKKSNESSKAPFPSPSVIKTLEELLGKKKRTSSAPVTRVSSSQISVKTDPRDRLFYNKSKTSGNSDQAISGTKFSAQSFRGNLVEQRTISEEQTGSSSVPSKSKSNLQTDADMSKDNSKIKKVKNAPSELDVESSFSVTSDKSANILQTSKEFKDVKQKEKDNPSTKLKSIKGSDKDTVSTSSKGKEAVKKIDTFKERSKSDKVFNKLVGKGKGMSSKITTIDNKISSEKSAKGKGVEHKQLISSTDSSKATLMDYKQSIITNDSSKGSLDKNTIASSESSKPSITDKNTLESSKSSLTDYKQTLIASNSEKSPRDRIKSTSPKYKISVLDMVSKKVSAKANDKDEVEEMYSDENKDENVRENLRSRIIITTEDGVTPTAKSVNDGKADKNYVSSKQSRSRLKKDEVGSDVEQNVKKLVEDTKGKKSLEEVKEKKKMKSKKIDTSSLNAYGAKKTNDKDVAKPSKLKGLFNKIDRVVADLGTYMEIDTIAKFDTECNAELEASTSSPKTKDKEKNKDKEKEKGKDRDREKEREKEKEKEREREREKEREWEREKEKEKEREKERDKDKDKAKNIGVSKTIHKDKSKANAIMRNDTEESTSKLYKSRKVDNYDIKSMTDAEDKVRKKQNAKRKTKDDESIPYVDKSTDKDHPLKNRKASRTKDSDISSEDSKSGIPGISNKQNINDLSNNKEGDMQKPIKGKFIDKRAKDFRSTKTEHVSSKKESTKSTPKSKLEHATVDSKNLNSEYVVEASQSAYKKIADKLKILYTGQEKSEESDTKENKLQDKKGLKDGFGDGEIKIGGLSELKDDKKGHSLSDEKDLNKHTKTYGHVKPLALPKGDITTDSVNDIDSDLELDESETREREVSCMGDSKQPLEPAENSLSTSAASIISLQSSKAQENQSLSEQSTEQVTTSTLEDHNSTNSSFAMALMNYPSRLLESGSSRSGSDLSRSVAQSLMVRSVCNLSSSFKRFINNQGSQIAIQHLAENLIPEERSLREEEFAVAVVTKKSNWLNQNVVVQSLDKISSSLRRLVIGEKKDVNSSADYQKKQQEQEKIRKLQETRKQKILSLQKKLGERIYQLKQESGVLTPDSISILTCEEDISTLDNFDVMNPMFREMLLQSVIGNSELEGEEIGLKIPQLSTTVLSSDSSSAENLQEFNSTNITKFHTFDPGLSTIVGGDSVISLVKDEVENKEKDSNQVQDTAQPSHFAFAVVKNESSNINSCGVSALSLLTPDNCVNEIETAHSLITVAAINPGTNKPKANNNRVGMATSCTRLLSVTSTNIPPNDVSKMDLPTARTRNKGPFITLVPESSSLAVSLILPSEISEGTVHSKLSEPSNSQAEENESKKSSQNDFRSKSSKSVKPFSASTLFLNQSSENKERYIDSATENKERYVDSATESSSSAVTVSKLDSSMSAKAGNILSAVLGATGHDGVEDINQEPSTSTGRRLETESDEYMITVLVMEPIGAKAKGKRRAEDAIDRTLDKLLSSMKNLVKKRNAKRDQIRARNESLQTIDDDVFSFAMILMDPSAASSTDTSHERICKPLTQQEAVSSTSKVSKEDEVDKKPINVNKITSWSQVKELDSNEFNEIIADTSIDYQDLSTEMNEDYLDIEKMSSELKEAKKKGDRFK